MDKLVDPWLTNFEDLLSREIPNAYRIYLRGRRYQSENRSEKAAMCENLNYLLHNSVVPNESTLGEGTRFAYGGIGVILHKDVEVGKWCTIGAGVTLGAKRDKGRTKKGGGRTSTPLLEDCVYLSAGVKIVGAITIGAFSIIGQNSVVTKSVPPFSIVGGIPGKILGTLTPENIMSYRATYLPIRSMSDDDFYELFLSYYEKQIPHEP